jgi:hypothetical protein
MMTLNTPTPGGLLAPYWEAAAQGKLALPHCPACDAWQWPLRARCLRCGGQWQWCEAKGNGRIAAWSVVRRAPDAARQPDVPYALAFIELDIGVRMFARLSLPAGGEPRIGARVRCDFATAVDGKSRLPIFVVEAPT